LKVLGFDLPAEAFPEAEPDDDETMLEITGGDDESQIQQLMSVISGGAGAQQGAKLAQQPSDS